MGGVGGWRKQVSLPSGRLPILVEEHWGQKKREGHWAILLPSHFLSIWFVWGGLPTSYNSLPIKRYQIGINIITLHLCKWWSYNLNLEQYFCFLAALPLGVCGRYPWVSGAEALASLPPPLTLPGNSFCLQGACNCAWGLPPSLRSMLVLCARRQEWGETTPSEAALNQ